MVKIIKSLFETFREERDHLKIRRRPSGFSISIFDSIKSVPGQDWEKVVPQSRGLMRQPYLTAIENSSGPSQQTKYVLFYKDNVPVAAAIFQIIVLTGENYGALTIARTAFERLTNSVKERAKIRVLICGHTHISGDHGFIYSKEISQREAYHALADACYRIRRSEKLDGKIHLQLIKDFYEREVAASGYLRVFKYHQFKVDPNMIVAIRPDWRTFDDYLNAMNTKYRKKALSVIKQAAGLERRSLTAAEIRSNYEQIQALYVNVTNKAKVRINQFDTSYFVELKEQMPDQFELISYYKDGRMVAFSTVLEWAEVCEGHAIGINYDLNHEHALYLNILYDFVKIALDRKKHSLILGRTAMEMKSNIGAEPYDMYCYVRHSGPVMNRAFKPVINYIKQSEWTQRNPFKEQKEQHNPNDSLI